MNERIRNFCIIAHIDHGKSTLADRLLEITHTVLKRDMKDQVLDQMELERERGITIKLQPVRMSHKGYELNLIDTPGHVDFTYEVSRSLAAVEGAILLVDATQGVEAQTISNLYQAVDNNLEIIPVINKIDLPNADVKRVNAEIVTLLGVQEKDILQVSAKNGKGVLEMLSKVIEKVPCPKGKTDADFRALIFDSQFDTYRGVIAYCRVIDGAIRKGEKIKLLGTGAEAEALEVGMFTPSLELTETLKTGSIGYIVTNLKSVHDCRVGDTISPLRNTQAVPLPGYKKLQSMVFAGLFPKEGDEYPMLREALEKLQLNDAALTFEPDHSPALGFGYRCGLLGLLHLEIVQERIKREYDIDLVVTVPSVAYKVFLNESGIAAQRKKVKTRTVSDHLTISSPHELPPVTHISHIEEPWVSIHIVTPQDHVGSLMQVVEDSEGAYKNTEYLDEGRVVLTYEIPLASLLADFYDKVKSTSSGYASLSYEIKEYRRCDVERLDILIAEEQVDALSVIVYKKDRYRRGRAIVDALKDVVPRQLYEVKIQSAVGGSIIASSRVPALRKDVTAKLYGGDVTRKRKLLEKQKKGKKRMKRFGKVTLPQEAFRAILKR
ncbi:translation elongation factor 4 [Patescibacteria group bacterium]